MRLLPAGSAVTTGQARYPAVRLPVQSPVLVTMDMAANAQPSVEDVA
eukprot:SAG11_NODE_14074_length_626_cov_1.045541_2_plen_46_part_01